MIVLDAIVVDSTHLELTTPIATRRGKTVRISVAESADRDAERQEWFAASASGLDNAYGDSEPDYPTSLVRESNPGYGP
jgi:hypothetical protein